MAAGKVLNKRPAIRTRRVAEAEGSSVYLNAGHDSGLEIGTKLTVYKIGRQIKDPTSGLVIGNTEEKGGDVKVVRYFGDDGAVAELTSGALPSAGDLVRLRE